MRLHPRSRQEHHGGNLTGHMSAGLISLRNDHVDSGLLCANRLYSGIAGETSRAVLVLSLSRNFLKASGAKSRCTGVEIDNRK